MLRTKKLLSLVQRELDGLKQTIPSVVLKSLLPYSNVYSQLFGDRGITYASYTKSCITTPYSYDFPSYERCRAKGFSRNTYSPLEYYFVNIPQDKQLEITEYLKGNIEKICL